jgi:hypothetical protein
LLMGDGREVVGGSERALKRRAEEAKGAKIFTCRACTSPYKDESGSGSGTKYNSGFCSNTRRAARSEAKGPTYSTPAVYSICASWASIVT